MREGTVGKILDYIFLFLWRGTILGLIIICTITLIKIHTQLSEIKPQVTEVHTNNFPDTHFVDQVFKNVMEVNNNGEKEIDGK